MLAVGENKERSEGLEQMAQVRVKMATTTRTSTDQVIRLPRGGRHQSRPGIRGATYLNLLINQSKAV